MKNRFERFVFSFLILAIIVGITGIVLVKVHDAHAPYTKRKFCKYIEEQTGEHVELSWYLSPLGRYTDVVIIGDMMAELARNDRGISRETAKELLVAYQEDSFYFRPVSEQTWEVLNLSQDELSLETVKSILGGADFFSHVGSVDMYRLDNGDTIYLTIREDGLVGRGQLIHELIQNELYDRRWTP